MGERDSRARGPRSACVFIAYETGGGGNRKAIMNMVQNMTQPDKITCDRKTPHAYTKKSQINDCTPSYSEFFPFIILQVREKSEIS